MTQDKSNVAKTERIDIDGTLAKKSAKETELVQKTDAKKRSELDEIIEQIKQDESHQKAQKKQAEELKKTLAQKIAEDELVQVSELERELRELERKAEERNLVSRETEVMKYGASAQQQNQAQDMYKGPQDMYKRDEYTSAMHSQNESANEAKSSRMNSYSNEAPSAIRDEMEKVKNIYKRHS